MGRCGRVEGRVTEVAWREQDYRKNEMYGSVENGSVENMKVCREKASRQQQVWRVECGRVVSVSVKCVWSECVCPTLYFNMPAFTSHGIFSRHHGSPPDSPLAILVPEKRKIISLCLLYPVTGVWP